MEYCVIKKDLKYCILFDLSFRNFFNLNLIGMVYNLLCFVFS